MRIQNLLPAECQYCKEGYTVKPECKPIAQCYICKQGTHDICIKNELDRVKCCEDIFTVAGMQWICKECDENQKESVTQSKKKKNPMYSLRTKLIITYKGQQLEIQTVSLFKMKHLLQ